MRTYDVFNSNETRKYLSCDFAEWKLFKFTARSNHCGGRHFQVLCEILSLPQIPKTVQLSTGKNSAKYNALNSYIECVLAVIFADPQREGYKFHSPLGSVGKLSAETHFNFPVPPFYHFPGICKNVADTWPAATRVLSRGRKREDPGNEVAMRFLSPHVDWGKHRVLLISSEVFPHPILPLHWTQVEYCYYFNAVGVLGQYYFRFLCSDSPGYSEEVKLRALVLGHLVGHIWCLHSDYWRHLLGIPFGHRWPNGDKLMHFDLAKLHVLQPNVAVLEIGSNDLCDISSDPETVGSTIITLPDWSITGWI